MSATTNMPTVTTTDIAMIIVISIAVNSLLKNIFLFYAA